MGWKEYFSSPQTVMATRRKNLLRDVFLKGNDIDIQGYVTRDQSACQSKVAIGESSSPMAISPLAVLCRRCGGATITADNKTLDSVMMEKDVLRTFKRQQKQQQQGVSLKTIQIVYESYPQALREDPCLHYALTSCPSLDIIQYLLSKNEDLIVSTKNGYLPIHSACTNPKCSPEIIEYLLECYPESIKVPITTDSKPRKTLLPIHLAIKHGAPLDTVKLLVAKYDTCLKESDYEVRGGGAVQANKTPDKNGWYHHRSAAGYVGSTLMATPIWFHSTACGTPLHIACSNRAIKLDVVRFLFNCYPRALITKNTYGYLPFHLACKYGTTLDVISFLIMKCPEAIAEPTSDMQNPLLLALSYCQVNKVSLMTVQYLMAKHPQVGYDNPPTGLFQLYSDEAEESGASPKITTYLRQVVAASRKGYSPIPNFSML